MAANGSAVAVFVAGAAVGALALARPAEPRVIYSKTVGTALEFTGQGQVVPANHVVIALGLFLALVLLAVGAGLVMMRRARGRRRAVGRQAVAGDVIDAIDPAR